MALIDIRDLTFAYPGSYDNVFEHLSGPSFCWTSPPTIWIWRAAGW